MTISIWRYSHLALAVSSFLFVALASVTGIILSVESVQENSYSYQIEDLDEIQLSEVLPVLIEKYPEITELKVDERGYVSLKGFDIEGEKIDAFIDPKSGAILGQPQEQSDFYKWVTALHRSLFLKEIGRFFIGLTAFLLLLITISGIILVVKRQHGWKRFFNKISRDSFFQYYHVVLGRLSLIPIFILALTGTWLSLVRFGVIAEEKITHEIKAPASEVPDERTAVADFSIMQQTTLAQVNSIEFPFVDDDPEEYFTLKLKDREIVLNQFDGSILSEINSPASASLTTLSLNLHTGKTSIIWAIIIGIASINILFFIYSGFGITLRRRKHRIQNKYKAAEANYVILVGSENGSTLFFAGSIHQQLLAQKKLSYLGELNGYTSFPKAEHLIIFTSTYGLGDAPGNASHFSKLLASIPQDHPVKVSVVGFGSYAYKDFCAYAQEIDEQLSNQSWAEPFLEMHTVNDKSPVEFTEWVEKWSEKTGLVLTTTAASYNPTPAGLHKFRVIARTTVSGPDESFIITLQPLKSTRFISGDLLAIYPAGDHRERFYSIGKMDGNIQLVVKYHQNGIGSEFLNALTTGATIEGRISASTDFHFPAKAPAVIMISNGTGIAPFLGMLQENVNKTATRLYAGFRKETALTNGYRKFADEQIKEGRLQSLQLAFSREGNQCYVMDLIKQDADFFATQLENSAVIMICGSLNMQRDVEAVISGICFARHKKQIEDYKKNGQILTDCY